MLTVRVPPGRPVERSYILSVILGDFLGIPFREEPYGGSAVVVTAEDGKELIVNDDLFVRPENEWLSPAVLPRLPLDRWDVAGDFPEAVLLESTLPVIYGTGTPGGRKADIGSERIVLAPDLFGSCFFMLTRYEEFVIAERDDHQRFPAEHSVAGREGFLGRPVVNEYAYILWLALQRLWPGLEKRKRQFSVTVSHDVDEGYAFKDLSPAGVLRRGVRESRSTGSLKAGVRTAAGWVSAKIGRDPLDSFDLIMDLSERRGLESTFFFLALRHPRGIDGRYRIDHRLYRRLIRRIHGRNHRVGLHASYHSYRDPELLKGELDRLRSVCAEEGVTQGEWGSRQHYLRWATPETFNCLEQAGADYDTTLTYPEVPGFRCGTCYDYRAFDVRRGAPLSLVERPLIIMDATVLDERYMGLGEQPRQALELMLGLKEQCRAHNGRFTLLWHNNRFSDGIERALYENVIDG